MLLAGSPGFAAEQNENGIGLKPPSISGFRWLIRDYKPTEVSPVSLSNTGRLEALIRGGNLYLSLQDAIALAIENNLDIYSQRYGPLIAEQDLLRAESGGVLRGVSQSVQQGSAGAGQGVSSGALGSATGGSTTSASGSASSVNGIITQLGPTTPNLDPVLQGFYGYFHTTTPETSTFITETTSLVTKSNNANFSLTQGFLTGGNAVLSFDNRWVDQNSINNSINPSASVLLDLTVSQNLLQGFGIAVNNRNIRISRNEVKLSNLVFTEQVITTVSNIVTLYWQLVSLNDAVTYAKQNLALSDKTYSDNKRQVEIGTLAPIEITRAEAEVAARQQDVTVAETNVLQQETIIKNSLSRNGVANPLVAAARIVPTDRIRVPENETLSALPDLFETALKNRPELEQSRLNLDNSKISIEGLKNGLLPVVTAFGELTNNGLAGSTNPGAEPPPDPYFVGGYGTALAQTFRRNFPNYNVGVNYSITLRNRSAQADYVYNTLQLRQSEVALQKQINQIGVDVQNARIGVQQAEARYRSAVKQRILQEQTLDAEQKKLGLGASTIFLVIQAQRDLAQARSNEVTAESQYQQSQVNLQVATGQVLSAYNINMIEAHQGVVSQAPAVLPASQ
jgi:outer membrane protein TolC